MVEASEKLITLKEASKMTPYSSDYLGLLVRKGRLQGYKKNGRWFTTSGDVESYMKRAAESSYEHQQALNVKIPAQEIRTASNNLRWAIVMLIIVSLGAAYTWKIMDDKKNENVKNKYRIVEDSENNLLIYANDPNRIKSVKILPKE